MEKQEILAKIGEVQLELEGLKNNLDQALAVKNNLIQIYFKSLEVKPTEPEIKVKK